MINPLRNVTAKGKALFNAKDCVDVLKAKFGKNTDPAYCIKEITAESLKTRRDISRRKKFKTVTGSSNFQVIIFSPNSSTIRVSNYICACNDCLSDFGSCSKFRVVKMKL